MKLKTIANAFEEKVNEDKYGIAVFDNERNFTREELSRLADTIAAKLPQDSRRIGIIIYDSVRFGQLKKDLLGVTNTMLTKSLRELEEDGLVHREQFNEVPPHVEYSLTDMGHDLLPVFYAIMNWGFKYEKEIFEVKEDK